MNKNWIVSPTKTANKQAKKLNKNVLSILYSIFYILYFLFEDLANKGPDLFDWPNYSKLHSKKGSDKRHCHLQKGKPTYVCCWEIIDKKRKIIEVYYVGTHEKAPY